MLGSRGKRAREVLGAKAIWHNQLNVLAIHFCITNTTSVICDLVTIFRFHISVF
jgi:hypothetical protein